MNRVQTAIEIAAPLEVVWDTVMDPNRFDDWVTIHNALDSEVTPPLTEGSRFVQSLKIPGLPIMKINWEIESCEAPLMTIWHGQGPARSQASSEYHLTALSKSKTRFEYINEFTFPGGPLGRLAGRALLAGIPEREAEASLKQLKQLIEGS